MKGDTKKVHGSNKIKFQWFVNAEADFKFEFDYWLKDIFYINVASDKHSFEFYIFEPVVFKGYLDFHKIVLIWETSGIQAIRHSFGCHYQSILNILYMLYKRHNF